MVKPIRLIAGYYKASPLGNNLFKLKDIDRYKPYAGIYKLQRMEGDKHYYINIKPKKRKCNECGENLTHNKFLGKMNCENCNPYYE